MTIKISDIAGLLRNASAADAVRIRYSHGLELAAAALGHRTLEAFQTAQTVGTEPDHLHGVRHLVLDIDLAAERAEKLGLNVPLEQLRELLQAAFATRCKWIGVHAGFTSLELAFKRNVEQALLADPEILTAIGGAQNEDRFSMEVDYRLAADEVGVGEQICVDLVGRLNEKSKAASADNTVVVYGTLAIKRLGECCFSEPTAEVVRLADV